MNFKDFFENTQQDDFEAWEAKAYAMPQVQQELQQTGNITIKTLRSLGIPEGMANYLSRVLSKKYGDMNKFYAHQDAQRPPTDDGFFYHVTLKTRIPIIKRNKALMPGMTPTFSNYEGYSQGRLFLCDVGGLNFWKQRVGEHEFHNTDRPQGIVVLRIPKQSLQGYQIVPDEVGTTDSHNPSYYVTQAIPMNLVQMVS